MLSTIRQHKFQAFLPLSDMTLMKEKALPLLLFFLLSFPIVDEEKGDANRGLASSWTIIPSLSLAGLHY